MKRITLLFKFSGIFPSRKTSKFKPNQYICITAFMLLTFLCSPLSAGNKEKSAESGSSQREETITTEDTTVNSAESSVSQREETITTEDTTINSAENSIFQREETITTEDTTIDSFESDIFQSEETEVWNQERKISAESGIAQNVETYSHKRFFEFGLEYPTSFGVHLRYLLTRNVYTHFGLGFTPEFFLKSFERFSPSLGYLSEEEAKIISDTFKNAMYLDVRLAWMPYIQKFKGGPYLEAGVSGSFFGRGELKGSTLSKALPHAGFDKTKKYSAKTNSYNATAHIGYQIPFEKVNLNIEFGVIKIMGTHLINVTTRTAPTLLSEKQKKSFQNFLEKKGWIFPTGSVWISFSF